MRASKQPILEVAGSQSTNLPMLDNVWPLSLGNSTRLRVGLDGGVNGRMANEELWGPPSTANTSNYFFKTNRVSAFGDCGPRELPRPNDPTLGDERQMPHPPGDASLAVTNRLMTRQ